MPIIKRINKYQGLRDIDVFIEEKGLTSEYFNITGVPSEIPQGKSSFLVGGSPFLKNNIEIKIEMIDSAGNTIYMEPVSNYLESGARRVSIEVYPTTAPGTAKLYVLGELKRKYKQFIQPPISTDEITNPAPPFSAADPPSQAFLNQFVDDVPSNFQGVYNVRYEMPVQINTTIPNTEPILFYKQPRLTVTEIVKGFVSETVPSASYEVSGTLSINRTQDSQQEDPPTEPADGQPSGLSLSDRFDVGRALAIFKNRRSTKIDPYRNSLFGKRGRIMRRSSPEVDKSTGIINSVGSTPENNENKISSTFVGETLNINNITIDTSKLPPFMPYTVTGSYTTEIKSVLNDTTFVPLEDFNVDIPGGGKFPADIVSADFTASIHPTPGFLISTTEFRSFADITIGNLRTFSGDVYKAKVYGKSKGSLGDFEPMYEAFIESSEVLVDKFSPTGFTSTGYFYTQSIVDAYWTIEGGSHTTSLSNPDPVGTAVESDDTMIDGVMISGSNYLRDSKVVFKTRHQYDLEPNVAYNVQFNAHFFTADKNLSPVPGDMVENDALLEVYVTGSKAGNKELLGRVDIPSVATQGRIDNIFKTFISADIPVPKMALEFHVKAGRFIIQDLSVRPMSETNFNPDYHRVIVPMPHPMPVKPDTYDFVVELFDVNNNLAETFATAENVEFTGAPLMISGPGNFLSGSMMLGTGMELYGGSAFLRTTGYRGFEYTLANNLGGFMVFSGSIGGPSAPENLITSSEDYDGVGLEIIDAHTANNPRYLRFGTNPSRFEVVTDTFYFGKQRDQANAQFVSGSQGKLELSSSFFHLTPEGKVTGSAILLGSKPDNFLQFDDNQLTVKGNLSVNQITTPAEIGGSPSTVSNASSSITPQGFAKFVSASIGGFEVSTTQINDTDDDLVLNSSGQITGSKVLFSGGKIASFNLSNDAFSTDSFFISSSATGNDMFISSSNFNVKASGDVTGSNVNFIGGKIGGFTLSTNELTATNFTLDPSEKRISLGTGDTIFIADGDEGIQLGSASFANAPFNVTTAGVMKAESGTVAGWTMTTSTLEGGDLILSKEGSIRSRGYQTDVAGSGFILTAASGGFLEVENAKIRGTLSTAVFEKESVNAVGGQLYIANSTTLTASIENPGGFHNSTQRTMSVVNASGFVSGEILTAKKISATGFNTEYILVQSSSRTDSTSDTDLSGNIFVQRGFGQGTSGDSGSLGGPAGSATNYTGSQVLVSTGRVGTGYIRLNANPSDQATPYIDVVERTGNGLYDVSLKARLGDLSGVAGSRNVPLGFTGFGLMSEVAFLSGSNIKLEAPTFLLGDKNANFVSGSTGKMEISSSNFHLKPDGSVIISGSTTTEVNISTPKFFLGGGGQFISGSNGNLEVSSSNFHLSSSGDVTMTGAITATSGKIAGYNISGNDLSANSGNVLIEGGVGGTITLGAGIGATANRQIILNSADTAGANEVRISVGHGTQTLAPFQVNAVGAMTSSAAKISGSDIRINTPEFDLDDGTVTLSGNILFKSQSADPSEGVILKGRIGQITTGVGTSKFGFSAGKGDYSTISNTLPVPAVIQAEGGGKARIIRMDGDSKSFGAIASPPDPTFGVSYGKQQLAMGLNFMAVRVAALTYDVSSLTPTMGPGGKPTGSGFTIDTFTAPTERFNNTEGHHYVNIQSVSSGSVTICKEGIPNHDNTGGVSIFSYYDDTIQSNYPFYVKAGTYIDGNLSVTGTLTINGSTIHSLVNRGYFDGGEQNDISQTGTSDVVQYLDFNNGVRMQDNLGYRMPRPGSITAVSFQCNVTTATVAPLTMVDDEGSTIRVNVRKNGNSVFYAQKTDVQSTGLKGAQATQAVGNDEFVAGDILTLHVQIIPGGGFGGNFSDLVLTDPNAIFEVTFDT